MPVRTHIVSVAFGSTLGCFENRERNLLPIDNNFDCCSRESRDSYRLPVIIEHLHLEPISGTEGLVALQFADEIPFLPRLHEFSLSASCQGLWQT